MILRKTDAIVLKVSKNGIIYRLAGENEIRKSRLLIEIESMRFAFEHNDVCYLVKDFLPSTTK
jgi:hypothetical protein